MRPPATRLLTVLASAVLAGAGFGALTSLVNGVSDHYADFESRQATTGGTSPVEIASVLLDSGWAWAGAAVAIGWLVTRATKNLPVALTHGAVAGVLALLAATGAYGLTDTIRNEATYPWYESESPLWWVASFVLGAPLGAIGACIKRPGWTGLLARLTVPVGAAAQMIVLPPGRNERITTIGQAVVLTAAAALSGFVIVRFLRTERRRPTPLTPTGPD
ncbi:hypothetical protein [Actinomadura sp. KC216]|uniref:hypothetical protein n=1 Tax=Actinomadura sp. KC216 TaxID=2530370 RepID=UPI001FB68E46|nr:hypothetical protein [Actinomadura sp. KC216]